MSKMSVKSRTVSRQLFQDTAAMVKGLPFTYADRYRIALALSNIFIEYNPRFDTDKFLKVLRGNI